MSTGLFTLRQRDYNPNLGRFISEDPIRLESGETNFYQYAFNAPTYYVDPDGESPISKAAIIAVKKAKQRFLRKLIKDRITSRLKKLLTKKGFKQAAKRYAKETEIMITYQLICPCGFKSNSVGYGVDVWTSGFFVPVYVDGDERLHQLYIEEREGEAEEEYEARLESSIKESTIQQFGENAVYMSLSEVSGGPVVKCPHCRERCAKFRCDGM